MAGQGVRGRASCTYLQASALIVFKGTVAIVVVGLFEKADLSKQSPIKSFIN